MDSIYAKMKDLYYALLRTSSLVESFAALDGHITMGLKSLTTTDLIVYPGTEETEILALDEHHWKLMCAMGYLTMR